MIGDSYRHAYEALKADLARARDGERIDLYERAGASLDAFVAAVAVDARRLRAIAEIAPETATEIRARAAAMRLPRTVLDPAHDASFARLWAAALDEAQLRMLQGALAEEAVRRRRERLAGQASGAASAAD
jgi:hypothetical protein